MVDINLPPLLLISILNTYLRDKYASLSILCEEEDLEYDTLLKILKDNGYTYNESSNRIL